MCQNSQDQCIIIIDQNKVSNNKQNRRIYPINQTCIINLMSEKPKPNSIDAMVNVPNSIKIAQHEKLFKPLRQIKPEDQVDSQLEVILRQLHVKLSNSFYKFEDDKKYVFQFPQSKFEDVRDGEYNAISYERKMIVQEEDTFKDRLSQQQLNQIYQKGQFQVRSQNQFIKLPYRWKINDVLFRGKENIILIWNKGLANIYDILINGIQSLTTRIPQTIISLFKIPKMAFSLIFGCKKVKTHFSFNYQQWIALEFFQNILETQYQKYHQGWGRQFWEYMFVNYQSKIHQSDNRADFKDNAEYQQCLRKKQQLRNKYNQQILDRSNKISIISKIDDDFQMKWGKIRKRTITEVENSLVDDQPIQNDNQQGKLKEAKKQKERDQKVLQIVQQKKFTMYLTHTQRSLKNLKFQEKLIEAILCLLRLFQAIMIIQEQFNKEKERNLNGVRTKIREKYPIRSLSSNFFYKKVSQQYDVLEQNLKEDFYNNLLKKESLKFTTSEVQKSVYMKFLQFRKNYPQNLQKFKRQTHLKDLIIPSRIFYSSYLLLPPFEIKKTTNYDGIDIFTLIKSRELKIDTSTNFWKIKLYWMRYKSWTINCFVFLVGQAFKGPIGLRCLFGLTQFQYDYSINYQTAQKYSYKRKPVGALFLKVLQGINNSRVDFQAKPDRGILGKKFSRIFNLIQCYIFRLLIVAVLIVLILYPIAIIINVVLSTVLVVTVWLWTPIIMLITYLFNIFIYQFQCSDQYRSCGMRFIPIPAYIFITARCLISIVFYILHFLLTPIYCLFLLILRIIQRLFRTITDIVMYILLKFLGRTPSTNTSIAWKIAGPGMSKSLYMSLSENDVLVLTQAELQKIYMQKLYDKTNNKISQHVKKLNSIINILIQPYGSNVYPSQSLIHQNMNNLLNEFNQQYSRYMRRFPQRPYNVRFTIQEIDNYMQNCESIVRNFIRKHQMEDQIFEQYQLQKGQYRQLTHMIWVNLFQCGQEIFQPLETIDTRFKVSDMNADYEVMNQKVNSIKRALQGEVKLQSHSYKVARYKSKINTIDPNIFKISQLINKNSYNSVTSVVIIPNQQSNSNFSYIFVPHLNVREFKKYLSYLYNENKKSVQNILL